MDTSYPPRHKPTLKQIIRVGWDLCRFTVAEKAMTIRDRWRDRWDNFLDRVQRREEIALINSIADSCEEFEPKPERPATISITDARLTDLMNQIGPDRAQAAVAAGRDHSTIRIGVRKGFPGEGVRVYG